jgi:hypothetical protein
MTSLSIFGSSIDRDVFHEKHSIAKLLINQMVIHKLDEYTTLIFYRNVFFTVTDALYWFSTIGGINHTKSYNKLLKYNKKLLYINKKQYRNNIGTFIENYVFNKKIDGFIDDYLSKINK